MVAAYVTWRFGLQVVGLVWSCGLCAWFAGRRAPLCPSSGAQDLYTWLLPTVLGALVYRSLVWRGAVGYVSGLRDVGHHYAHHQELKIHTDGCCLWYLALWFTRHWSGVELWVMCPVCGTSGTIMPIIGSSRFIHMVAAYGTWCFGLQVVGLVWSCKPNRQVP